MSLSPNRVYFTQTNSSLYVYLPSYFREWNKIKWENPIFLYSPPPFFLLIQSGIFFLLPEAATSSHPIVSSSAQARQPVQPPFWCSSPSAACSAPSPSSPELPAPTSSSPWRVTFYSSPSHGTAAPLQLPFSRSMAPNTLSAPASAPPPGSPPPLGVQACPTMAAPPPSPPSPPGYPDSMAAAAPSHLPGGRPRPCPSHSSPFGPAAASTQPLSWHTVLVQPLSTGGWAISLVLDKMTMRSFVLCAAPSATPSTPDEVLFSPCRFSTRRRLSRC